MVPRAALPEIKSSRRSGFNSLLSNHRPQTASIVCVVAHPGDEVIAAGGSLEDWRHARFIHVTDGAPRHLDMALDAGYQCRDEYARARRHEFEAALDCAGLHAAAVDNLGYDAGEVSQRLANLTLTIAALLHEANAEFVITHPYEGEHPDRDATAFAVQSACALLDRDGIPAPVRIEAAGYHECDGSLRIGTFLTAAPTESVTMRLDAESQRLKRAMFDCLETQRPLLENAEIHSESFRIAPHYDFSRPPGAGQLEYERLGFPINGRRWRRLAADAARVLGLAD